MGFCGFGVSKANEKSKMIDKVLNEERLSCRSEVRILLLGTEESGKSTFLKQIQIKHGNGFDHDTVVDFQHTIYFNVVLGMRLLLNEHENLKIPWEKESTKPFCEQLLSKHQRTQLYDQITFMDLALAIEKCWEDSSVKQVFNSRNQGSDSIKIFFEDVRRISDKDWLPTNKDILYARRATKGMVELSVRINRFSYKFIDVKGQKLEKTKWLSCFDNVAAVIFMVACSEFNQVHIEDGMAMNRLQRAKILFGALKNNRVFQHNKFILLLNKVDLLTEKVKSGSKLSEHFPEFKGDDGSIDEVKNFILNFFIEAKKGQNSDLYFHFTTAVNTQNIFSVFNIDTILKHNCDICEMVLL